MANPAVTRITTEQYLYYLWSRNYLKNVILKRLEHSDAAKQINPLQYGFQKGKSCKMVSLLLQESWEYLRERNSDMHVC